MTLAEAVGVFARGFAYTRSLTHPCIAEAHGPLWVLRDGPGRREARAIEVLAVEVPPKAVAAFVATQRLEGHFVAAIDLEGASERAIKAAYKDLGYALMKTESLWVHNLDHVPPASSIPPVERVTTWEDAERVREKTRYRQITREQLDEDPPNLRLYALFDDGVAWGAVRSVRVGTAEGGPAGWVSNLWVAEVRRRRGYGRALMSRLLADDRAHGFQASVLTSSHAGAHLYPLLGYRRLGTLRLFRPVRRST